MNRVIVRALCFVPFGLCLGCMQPPSPQGVAQFTLAQRQYDAGQFSMAIRTLSSFLAREGQCMLAGDGHYRRGLCYRRIRPASAAAMSLAENDFHQAIRRSRRDPYVRGQAHVALGDLYFDGFAADTAGSIAQYTLAMELIEPNRPPTDMVLYRLGTAEQMMGQWRQADQHLSRCFNAFGDSGWAQKARASFGARTWRIEFDSFATLAEALAHVEELNREGWTADWTSLLENDQVTYVVRNGQFPTYAEAETRLRQLVAVDAEAWITPAQESIMSFY